MHAQKIKAEQRWRAAIGVPRNFDDRTKELLSIVKDAKWKATVANIAIRVQTYLSPINKNIDLLNRLIKRLAQQKEESEDNESNGEEILITKDIKQLEAMVAVEEARKSPAVGHSLETSWIDRAFTNLDIARENLKKHLNSVTRRQYLYSTIKISLNPWLEHGFPSEVFQQLASELRPHEIANLRDGVNLKRRSEDYGVLTRVHRKKMARMDADRGKPLSEGAKYFFSELEMNRERLARMYKYIEDGFNSMEDFSEKKLHLLEVVFDVYYNKEQDDQTPGILFDMSGFMREEVDWLSEYKDWASGGREKARGETCLDKYFIYCAEAYFPLDDEFTAELFEDFDFLYHGYLDPEEEFYNREEWNTSGCRYPFSITSDGKVRQRTFAETAGGRSTFALTCGTPYDPLLHQMSVKDPTTEW